ncbi:carbonate dehydratase [Pseudoalteromonas denitrificans]|jgi:carbonic anhydrase|uniref:Carbonic anhydrase n=1 Tax=Pseudoalteromonas denitrificans DSM 6059 TaxID=1123010 RepID=A0A1I1QKP7_9GAMM|nr:carbonate dehydratase [Pseudoalteromonas denitrificans]SFD22686.1 carbonic anhydrase [Pseudoalteromonas denitrificans DSM 6059]
MKSLKNLFDNNRHWACQTTKDNPEFFKVLSMQQNPEYLWIGCSDSRVPANEIVGLLPGELFVHRNVANVVVHTDHNCLSVMQYAVEVLKVKHIMIVGHYACGGVKAALDGARLGLIDNWLRHVVDVKEKHFEKLNAIENYEERLDTLCELNVIEQVKNVSQTSIVQNAWDNGQDLSVHGWIYGLKDGHLSDLNSCTTNSKELLSIYQQATQEVFER